MKVDRPLDLTKINKLLSSVDIVSSQVLKECESTNEELLSTHFKAGELAYCAAEYQSKGRGRRGRVWYSTQQKNILLSVARCYNQWPENLSAFSLAVGLSVAQTVNALFDLSAQIKWPNDVLVNGKKLAGVLVEMTGQANQQCQIVVGIGLNCQLTCQAEQTEYEWGDLMQLGIDPDRNELVAALVVTMADLFQSYPRNGFAPLRKSWNELSSFSGRTVQVTNRDSQILLEGQMQGVDKDGRLVLWVADGHEAKVDDVNLSVRVTG